MKRFNSWLLLIWLLLGGAAYAQKTTEIEPDNIIILVDVSKSIKRIGLADSVTARVICDVLQWQKIRQPGFVFKPIKGMEEEGGLERKWSEAGKKVLIVPYGDITTDETIESRVVPTELTGDFDIWETAIMKKWPQSFIDQWSYQDLARRRAAYLAEKNGFTSYWLFVVSDSIHEQKGSTAYKLTQESLFTNYQLAEVAGLELGQIRYKATNLRIIISHVKLKSGPGITPDPGGKPRPPCSITLTKQGSKEEPISVDEAVNLAWSCSCPEINSFTVNVSGRNGTKVKPGLRINQVKGGNSKRLPLEPGEYQITVRADGAKSATAYVRAGSTGLSWLGGGMIAALLVGGLFWFLRRKSKQNEPKKPGPSSEPPSPNIGGSGGLNDIDI